MTEQQLKEQIATLNAMCGAAVGYPGSYELMFEQTTGHDMPKAMLCRLNKDRCRISVFGNRFQLLPPLYDQIEAYTAGLVHGGILLPQQAATSGHSNQSERGALVRITETVEYEVALGKSDLAEGDDPEEIALAHFLEADDRDKWLVRVADRVSEVISGG